MAVNLATHRLAGAPRELYLPDTIKVVTQLVTHPNVTNNVTRVPKTSDTYHDTGNPRSSASGEMAWLAAGRPGGEAGGYNFIVGTRLVYYCGHLAKETWHAGVQAGNWYSVGTEHAFGGPEDWQGSLDTACWLHAAILECYDLPMSVFYWHQKWYGKYCPGQIFNRGLQTWVISKIQELRAIIRAHRQGSPAPVVRPVDEFAQPIPPRMPSGAIWDGKADLVTGNTKFEAQKLTVKAIAPANQRQWANTEALFTGPGVKTGGVIDILGWVKGQLVDGVSEWAIDVRGSRIWAGALDFEPKIDPAWAVIPPEDAPGVKVVNGRLYYPMNDEITGGLGRKITVHRAGNLRKWASTESEVVGVVSVGKERVFRYWTRGEPISMTLASGKTTIENIWYAEALHTGARMWSGLSEEKPN